MKHPNPRQSFIRLMQLLAVLAVFSVVGNMDTSAQGNPIAFQQGFVSGITDLGNPTTLQFGPDGRLYVAERYGTIYALTIQRNGPGDYSVTAQENIELIPQDIPNHTDTGEIDTSSGFVTDNRQVTGLVVTGTATNPVIYVSSSDPREGGGGGGADLNLDTNSGVISRLTWNGSAWDHLQLVRGLPRSEENHAVNGMALDETSNTLYVTVGGFTNMGAPSFNFTYIAEYAYAAAIVSIDLNTIGNTTYDMPTLDDPSRPNNPDGSDVNDPFGGNDGANQARIDPTGPVQIYASGFRNPYDVVLMENGRMYTIDNGPNYGWGGPPLNQNAGQCDDSINEDGSETHQDNLHFVTGEGYYGGHPAPVRGNPQGIYANEADSPVPFAEANPVECDYRIPGVEDGALATWVTSTNGLTEYTATNFSGEMQGDLLTVSYDGNVYRMKPTASGDALVDLTPGDPNDWGYVAEFGGFGIVPLDVTTQGDTDIFPGTIWVAVFVDKTIAVFEPVDFPCSGDYDTGLDEDGDGFNNADEIDNGTNPCSNGSKPPDNDGDFISDLNDDDDDNDTILDLVDAFQIDAQNGTQTTLPVRYDFFQDAPGTGFFGVGFTGLMTNGTTDYLDMFDLAELTVGGTAGKATVDNFTDGTAYGTTNTQDYAFQWGVNVTQADGQFGINAQLNNPFFSPSAEAGDEQGIYFGTGDQDNYFELALAADDTTGAIGFEVIVENAGVPNRVFYPVAGATSSTKINLYLSIDPVAGTVQPKYSLDDAPFVDLGSAITLTGSLLNVVQTNQVMAVGLIAHYAPGSTAFGGTWDYVFIEAEQPGVLGVTPSPASYGDVVQGTFLDQTLTLRNLGQAGDQDISVSSMSINGTSEFIIMTDPSPVVLAPGDTAEVVVRYQPADVGSDTATLDVTHDGLNSPTSATLNGNGIVEFDPIYRVNIGGDLIADATLDWSADSGTSPSPYANHATSGATLTSTGSVIDMSDPSLPSYTPSNLFNTGRWDPNNGSANEMTYDFPVDNGRYEVRLYFAETFAGTASNGARVWDAELEGTVPANFNDIDRYALAGFETGYMLAAEADVTDGSLTVRFLHEVENPELQGIEIYPVFVAPTSDLSASPAPIDFGGVSVGVSSDQTLTLTNTGIASDPAITVNSISYSGTDAADFSDDLSAPVVIQPGNSINVTVSINASSGGTKTATLTVNHDGGNSPSDVNLTAIAYQSGALEMTPDPLLFGQVALGSSSTLPITLTNLGSPTDADIEVTNLVVTGSNTYQFQFEAYADPLIISGGESVDIDVTFTPAQVGANNVTISAAHDGNNSPVTIQASGEGVELSGDPIYRVNVGGPTITDAVLDWEADTGSVFSPYIVSGGGGYSSTGNPIDITSPTIPAGTPMSMFQTERWDPNDSSPMTYEFPVADGRYEVRLYVAEIYSGISAAGQRVFDASLEGNIPAAFNNIDPFDLAGFEAGYMLSAEVDVSDGDLTLAFAHVTENPALKGIEIVPVGAPTPTSELESDPMSYDFGATDITVPDTHSFVVTNTGALDAPAIDITSINFTGTGAAAFSSDFVGTVTLQPTESTTVTVTFDPSATQTYSASMIVNNTGETPALSVALSGFGSEPSVLTQDVTSIDFGNVVLGNNSSDSVVVTNLGGTGDPDISISALNITGTDASDFSHSETLPIVIAPGASATIDLSFAPSVAGAKTALLTIVSDGTQGDLTVNLSGTGDEPASSGTPIYRVNVGGAVITDATLDWSADNDTSPSPYLIAGAGGFSGTGNPINTSNPSLPAGTPMSLFQQERWDPASGDEMTYEFPVTNGTYEVRIYVAEIYNGITTAGQRVFDAEVEGSIPPAFDDIDPFALAGYEAGYMLSAEVTVSDGNLTILFAHVTENPAVKGIEILTVGSSSPVATLASDPASYDFGAVQVGGNASHAFTLTNDGDTGAPALTISSVSFGDASYTSDFSSPVVLNVGESTTVNVTFAPTVAGAINTDMTIAHDGDNAPTVVSLTGSGTQAGILAQDVNAVDFGNVVIGNNGNGTVTVTNLGTSGDPDITITALNITGTDAGDFSHSETLPLVISAGASEVIDLTFAPTVAGAKTALLTIVSNGTQGDLTVNLSGTADEPSTGGTPIVRINVGGGIVTDPNGIMNWSSDSGSAPSPYHVIGGDGFSGTGNAIDMTDPSIPSGTPMSLFQTERWDPNDGVANALTYEVPVSTGTYEVRVYVAETYSGIGAAGQRVFDAEVEGSVPPAFDNIDPYALAGFETAYMVSSEVNVTDGNLTLRFLHVTENPAIKAIEILEISTSPVATLASDPASYDFGAVQVGGNASHAFTLTNDGDVGAPALTISSVSFGDASYTSDFSSPVVLNVGESTTVNVTFAPTVAGVINTDMTIAHDGNNAPTVVSLTGSGSQANVLAQDVSNVNFGSVVIGNNANGTVTVTNLGTSGDPDITITALNITGTDAGDFSHSETLPLIVSAGASEVIDLTFAPTVAGAKTALLTIVSNGTQGDLTVNLSGTATDPAPNTATAIVRIESGGDILTSSTYNPSFYIENTSAAGQEIVSVSFDISTALVPDVVFDPLGTAGDTGSRCLFPDSTKAATTGFIAPADLCSDPFFAPYELGYNGITVDFNDFNVGEDFLFGVDIDPISTRGTTPPGPDHAASVSGYELLGSTVTVEFSDGSILTTELWRYNTSVTGSQNVARTNTLVAPSIQVLGTGTANAVVNSLNQTVRVSGPVGEEVSLLISEGDMVEQTGGGYDVDPFEFNTVLNVAEYSGVIGAGGTVDIPVTLLDDELIDGTYGGMNYIIAVIRDTDQTSNLSNRIVLEYDSSATPSLIFGSNLVFNAQEGQSVVMTDSTTSGTNDSTTPTIILTAVDDATSSAPTWLSLPASVIAGNNVSVDADALNLAPGTYTATVTGTASGYDNATFTVTLNVADLDVTITSPANNAVITGDSVTVSWTSSNGLPNDHIHVTLDDLSTPAVEPHAGSLGLNDSYTFSGVAAGDYRIIVEMANFNHIVYQGVSASVDITVEESTNVPPTVTNPGAQNNVEGDSVSLQIVATDPDDATLSYNAGATLPTGLSINPSTGLITGSPTTAGVYNVQVSVVDSANPAEVINFTWTITAPNQPPTVTNPGAQNNVEGDSVSLQIVATDPDDATLSYSAGATLPTGLSINPSTGLITGSPTTAGVYNVQVSVVDSANPAEVINFTWTITAPNQPPTVTNPGAQNNVEGDSVSLQIVATDPDDATLSYNAGASLPTGLSINPSTGLITGSPTTAGVYNVQVSVVDSANPAEVINFTWTITAPNQPPTVTNPGAQNNVQGDSVSLQIVATDPDDATLSYNAGASLPTGLSINPSTGLITGSPTTAGVYNVQVSVVDTANPPVVINFSWTITAPNLPPSVTNPGNQENLEGEAVNLQIVATDPDTPTLNYSAGATLPTGLTINPSTGLISGTISAGSYGVYNVQVSVSDGVNAPVNVNFTWTVYELVVGSG